MGGFPDTGSGVYSQRLSYGLFCIYTEIGIGLMFYKEFI